MTEPRANQSTHFGFRTVSEEEKPRLVMDVFHKVAARYDAMNDAMSFGLHRIWKRELIRLMNPRGGMHLLDVAGGTGDISFRFLDAGGEQVTLCDLNPSMLAEGRNRAIDRNKLTNLRFSCGDAQSLPFPDSTFDCYSIAFGIRNVTDINKALREAHRVLKPGGRFFCLEFSPVSRHPVKEIYDWYSFNIIPRMGTLIAKDAQPYQYLVESIRKFPDVKTFARMIQAAEFQQVSYRTISGGVVAIHYGWKI